MLNWYEEWINIFWLFEWWISYKIIELHNDNITKEKIEVEYNLHVCTALS